MRIRRHSKPKPHPLAALPPPHKFWVMPAKLAGGLCVAVALLMVFEGLTGLHVGPDASQQAAAQQDDWRPAGARDAVRLYSAYPDDVKFSELRQGRDGATCGIVTGTFEHGYRETRRFVYTSSGVTFGDGYYRKACDLS